MKKLKSFINAPANHHVAAIFAIIFCLTQLSGCGVFSSKGGRFNTSDDGPPGVDVDISKIHDAVPRVEPLHPYGTRDYKLGGRHYRVLKSSKGYVKTGYASWYGSKFHGGETSTQEKFNLYAMTAASKDLPLPSYVQVTNLRNGKKIIVRVNDRGPFHSNRILDLSYAAAKKLGFVDAGVAPVKIVAIDPKTWGKNPVPASGIAIAKAEGNKAKHLEKKPKKSEEPELFLQVGAFAEFDNAKQLSDKAGQLIDKPIKIKRKADLHLVQIGPIADCDERDRIRLFLEDHGFQNVTRVES